MSYQTETLHTYSQIAETFASMHNNSTTMETFYSKFKEYLPNGLIYDIGCGTGRDTSRLHTMGYQVEGFDFSEPMLDVAKREFPHCIFKQGNILTDFNDIEKVDGVWASASLLHFTEEDFKQSLNIIYNILKENRIFYISMKLKADKEEEFVQGRYFHYYTINELVTHLEMSSFEILFFEKTLNTPFVSFIVRK